MEPRVAEKKTLDRKGLKNRMKRHYGFTKFRDEYGLSENQLRKKIATDLYKNNHKDAAKIIKDIEDNEKEYLKELERKPVTEYKGIPIEKFMDMSMEEYMKIENGDNPEIAVNVKADTATTDAAGATKVGIPEDVLLEEEIHQLEETLIRCESEHKRWLSRHHDSLKQMGELEEELTKLRGKLVNLKEKYNCIAERDGKIVVKANETLEEKHKVEAALEEKRQKLESLKRVTICAYTNGTVALMEESATLVLDDTGADALYLELVDRDECQDLRAREIRALAKLLKIIENTATIEFEVVCDNDEMEKAYLALAGSHSGSGEDHSDSGDNHSGDAK